ncbi:translation termination factor GTPase eRF3 [Aspergillus alliaceus]|uniref:Elongation factor 1-alpha n=1 Tax=Petromyces alliaceus TaxID=209559 RepID=A0A5N7C1Z4_PETAA|nr:P-loop containing nucleoside triphosphate hydrolase protein [Aspergillus alliaceus]KAB8235220.1 P-loop containing nucleoside triphosphate hydrolase protein [Aspergillus alliaceus]KAE8388114.1 P-loop containing nucleoside triphosphate hydrolase protein [Aspergillus alliaceus]KAF5863729.1 translation termination factor GTPase eRF3 [Aspergillus burnettii]
MADHTPESWEDELSRQAEGVNLNAQSRPQAQAPSFRPGIASFQPGAASFVPGQSFQGYGGGFPQYGQYGQQGYGGYQYGQQQPYGQYGAYAQQPGGYNQGYNQQYGGGYQPQQQQQFAQQTSQAAQQPQAAETQPAQSAPKPAAAAPKAKVLSIGGASDSPAAPKTKVLSIGTPSPTPSSKMSSGTATPGDSKGPDAAQAAAKVTASKAIEKTEKKAEQKAAASGKTSPAPASGRSSPGRASPSRGEAAKAARAADAVAKEQQADVDEATLKEIYGEKKEHVNIVFIGHVDAGKSTLGGSILYVTGMVDERTLDKYKRDAKEAGRETWYLSWALDLTNEERSKGKTVEVGRAHFKLTVPTPEGPVERNFSILDAPGHKQYVHHMIGGASQADVGVLVISARKGEYETGFEKGGQTREHALLARNTGVQKLVVAVNKMDDPTVEWSHARFKECTVKVSKFLEALGYKKTDLLFMPISAQRTLGIKDRVPKDLAPWYDGPSLLEYLTDMKLPERKINAPFMMPITAKYRDMGTMVEGRVESGVIKKNANCIVMPNRSKVEITALYGETEDEIATATCGDQVRMRLRGVEEEDLLPGFVLCSPKRLVNCVSSFEAKIRILDLKSILSAGYNCVMHVHSAVEEVTFSALLHKCEPGTGRKSKRPPAFASKGQTIIARLEVTSTAGAVCVERFEDYNQMGRFTLRDQGQTIAIGMITKLIMNEADNN